MAAKKKSNVKKPAKKRAAARAKTPAKRAHAAKGKERESQNGVVYSDVLHELRSSLVSKLIR